MRRYKTVRFDAEPCGARCRPARSQPGMIWPSPRRLARARWMLEGNRTLLTRCSRLAEQRDDQFAKPPRAGVAGVAPRPVDADVERGKSNAWSPDRVLAHLAEHVGERSEE